MGVLHALRDPIEIDSEHPLLQLASSTPLLEDNLLSAICYTPLHYLVIGSPICSTGFHTALRLARRRRDKPFIPEGCMTFREICSTMDMAWKVVVNATEWFGRFER